MAASRILLGTPHVTVAVQDFPSDTVFVTFNDMDWAPQGTSFWGDRFFAGIGVAAVGIVSMRPNWYPPADMAAAIEAIRPIVHGRRVVTYGFSQGAYGALKFSKALEAFAALAFSPTYSIDPAIVGGFDQRFIEHHRPELANGSPIDAKDLCGKNYLFSDPLARVERDNADRIVQLPGLLPGQVESIPMYFMNHGTVRLISEARVGKTMVEWLLAPNLAPPKQALRALVRSGRRSSKTYLNERITQLTARPGASVGFLSRTALGLEATPRVFVDLFVALKRNAFTEAQALLAGLPDAALGERDPVALWKVFRSARFEPGELRLAAALKRLVPGNAFARLHAVDSYLTYRDKASAARELEEIVRLEDAVRHRNHLRGFARQLDHAKVLEELLDGPAWRAGWSAALRLEMQLEILDLHAASRDDRALLRSLVALAGEAERDQALRDRLLALLAKVDDQTQSLELAATRFGLRGEAITRFKLAQIFALIGRDRVRATRQLRDIRPSLDATAAVWHQYARCRDALGDPFEALVAEKRAMRYATGALREDLRLQVASLHMILRQRVRAVVQLLRLYRHSRTNAELLARGRDTARHFGLKRIALMFARQILRNRPDELDPMVDVALLQCMLGRFPQAARLADRVQSALQEGRALPEGAYPKLIQVLRFVQRPADAAAALERGLGLFPGNGQLAQMRESDRQVRGMFSGHDGASGARPLGEV